MGVAHAGAASLPETKIIQRLIGEHADLRVEQGHVDLGAAPGDRRAARSAAWMAMTRVERR